MMLTHIVLMASWAGRSNEKAPATLRGPAPFRSMKQSDQALPAISRSMRTMPEKSAPPWPASEYCW